MDKHSSISADYGQKSFITMGPGEGLGRGLFAFDRDPIYTNLFVIG
jgi:hypothetical protein